MEERYFKILLDCGHVGKGNSLEVSRYVAAKDNVDAFILGNGMPRVKRKHRKTGTLWVVEITYSEYCLCLIDEAMHPYLNTYKKRKCG